MLDLKTLIRKKTGLCWDFDVTHWPLSSILLLSAGQKQQLKLRRQLCGGRCRAETFMCWIQKGVTKTELQMSFCNSCPEEEPIASKIIQAPLQCQQNNAETSVENFKPFSALITLVTVMCRGNGVACDARMSKERDANERAPRGFYLPLDEAGCCVRGRAAI